MGTYIVTGVAGFIGSALAHALLKQGHVVVGIDNFSTGFRQAVPKDVLFYESDCQDATLYANLPKMNYDAIFHIAGQSSGEISFDDPVYDLRTNAESTLHLLQFALENSCFRFIYASTMTVYGKQPDCPISENASTYPISFYGVGKLASEHYLRIYEQYGMRSTALRLFNVYGPGQNMSNLRQGMVSIFMAMMLDDNTIHCKGSLERYRDFVYIDDVVSAFLLCLEHEKSYGKCINIGGSGRTTIDVLLKKLTQIHDKPVKIRCEGSTAGDLHGIYANLDVARQDLGYIPQISFDEGLRKMYDFYKNQQSTSNLL